MLRKRTSSNIILIAIVVVLVLLSVVSFVLYQNNTRNILAEKSKADMKKSTDQSIILTNSLIDNYFSELDTIAIFCSVNTGINDHEIFELLQQKNLGNTYSQIGVAGLDGFIYTGSGSKQKLCRRRANRRALCRRIPPPKRASGGFFYSRGLSRIFCSGRRLCGGSTLSF